MAATHSSEILKGLNDLRKLDKLCDVVLEADETQIHAHRAVLASFSPYFRLMFTTGMEESKNKLVCMKGVDKKSLQNLVDFAYTGEIVVNRENVQTLLPAADLLELPNVRKICCDFLASELHPSNCIGIAKFAESYLCEALFRRSMSYICHHFRAVYTEEEFRLLSKEDLVKFLSSDDLSTINSEDLVCGAIQVWIDYDSSSRHHLYDDLLFSCVRFREVSLNLLHKLEVNFDLKKCKSIISETIAHKQAKNPTPYSEAYNPRQPCDALCVMGGTNTRFPSLDSVESTKNGSVSWGEIAALPECRHKAAAFMLNDDLYVIGGKVSHVPLNGLVSHDPDNEVLKYDPENKVWRPVAPMLKKRCSLGVLVHNGYIYAIGGYDDDEYLSSMERYCPLTNKWELIPGEMRVRRSCLGCACLDGQFYAVGGYGPSCLNRWVEVPASAEHIGDSSVEKYSTSSGDWSLVASMSEKRINPGVGVAHDFLYAVGGHNGVAYLSSVERYHPHHNQWTRLTSMTQPRTGMGLVQMNDYLFVVGGFSGTTYLDTAEKYDPVKDSWSSLPKLRTPRAYFAISAMKSLPS